MDLIQKFTIGALVLLSVITAGMVVQQQILSQRLSRTDSGQQIDLEKYYAQRIARDAKIYADVVNLQKQRQFSQALEKLQEIKTAHPDNPQSYIYQAQLEYSQGHIAAAIHNYRLAVDSEPDYVDKKTPLFIGDTIMNLITEVRGKLHREKELKPGDKTILIALDDVYYLQRRIAGGCE